MAKPIVVVGSINLDLVGAAHRIPIAGETDFDSMGVYLRCSPTYGVHAVDTTAAGDAFNGALAVALVNGQDPLSSVSWASAVAALSVTRPGAQPSMPTSLEVVRFLADSQTPQVEQVTPTMPAPFSRETTMGRLHTVTNSEN